MIGNVLPGVTMGGSTWGAVRRHSQGRSPRSAVAAPTSSSRSTACTRTTAWPGLVNGITTTKRSSRRCPTPCREGSAENQGAGVSVNMIPRSGGNTTAHGFLGTFSNSSLQGENIDDDSSRPGLRTDFRGVRITCGTSTATLAGRSPRKPRFFGSGRDRGFAENVPNSTGGCPIPG